MFAVKIYIFFISKAYNHILLFVQSGLKDYVYAISLTLTLLPCYSSGERI